MEDWIEELGEDQGMQHLSGCVLDFVLCHNSNDKGGVIEGL